MPFSSPLVRTSRRPDSFFFFFLEYFISTRATSMSALAIRRRRISQERGLEERSAALLVRSGDVLEILVSDEKLGA